MAERELRRIVAAGAGPAAHDLLGLALARQGRAGEAEAEFRRALELFSEYFPARQNLARLYLQQQRGEDALRELRAAARLESLDRQLAFQLATLELAQGNTEASEAQLVSLAERFDSVRAMLDLARSLARRGEAQRAIGVLRHALDIAPNSEAVLSAYARLCVEHQAPVPAMATLEALTRMHPTVAEYHYLLGIARLQLAESDGAVEALERSLELEPRQILPLVALGLSFKDQKRYAESKEMLLRGLRLVPEHTDTLAALAEVEEGLGELDLAEQHVGHALELKGDNAEALYVLGRIRMAQGRYEDARDALERSVEIDSRKRRAHYVLSLAYARLGDRESSRRHLELYRKATKDAEELLIKMRTDAGLGVSGMGRGG
jgi:tetratricopeptide (TPR) repeat protein